MNHLLHIGLFSVEDQELDPAKDPSRWQKWNHGRNGIKMGSGAGAGAGGGSIDENCEPCY